MARTGAVPLRLWLMLLCAGLAIGCVLSVLDVLNQPARELLSAKNAKQRVVFVAKSSESADGTMPKKDAGGFDVEESPEEKQLQKMKQGAQKKSPDVDVKTPDAGDIAPPDIEANAPDEPTAASEKSIENAEPETPSGAEKPVAQEPVEEATAHDVSDGIDASLKALVVETHTALTPIKRGADSLVFAPAPEISKRTKQGLLPVKGKNHATAYDIYARGFQPKDDAAIVSIVITGLGFQAKAMAQALALPPEVTFSVSPYASDIATQIDSARNDGHEIWFDMPTQTEDYPVTDPGPLGIIETLQPKERDSRIEQMLIATRGAVGAVFWPEDNLPRNAGVFNAVVKKIRDHGLRVFYTNQNAPEMDGKTLRHADFLIQKTQTPSKVVSELKSIGKKLTMLERPAVLVVEASPHTITALAEWLPSLSSAPVALAPLSAQYLDFEAIKAAEEKAMEEAGKDKKKDSGGH